MFFIFVHFVRKGSFRQIWVKNTEQPIRFGNFHFGALQFVVFHFVHFEYKKDFWHSLIKFTVYRVSILSGLSGQLLDLVIVRLQYSYFDL